MLAVSKNKIGLNRKHNSSASSNDETSQKTTTLISSSTSLIGKMKINHIDANFNNEFANDRAKAIDGLEILETSINGQVTIGESKDDLYSIRMSKDSDTIIDDEAIEHTAMQHRAKSAEPTLMSSRLKRTSSLGIGNHSRPKALSTTSGDGTTQSIPSVKFDEKTSFATGVHNKSFGAPQRSKKSSINLFRKLSSLNLSGFFRSDSVKQRSNVSKSISFAPIEAKPLESIEQISRPRTAPPTESRNITDFQKGSEKNKAFGKDESNAVDTNRVSTPELNDVTTIERITRPNTSMAVIDVKDKCKIVPNEDTSYDAVLRSLGDRIGDLASARLVMNISNTMTMLAADGDECIKKIKLAQRVNSTPKSRSLSTILSEKFGFTSTSQTSNYDDTRGIGKETNSPSNSNHHNADSENEIYQALEINPLTHMFDGTKQPKISIEKYICRLVRYLNSFHEHDPSADSAGIRSIVVATFYIDRVREMNPNFILNSMNVHRLFLAATLIANKFIEDDHPTNEFMAGVGGVELKEINTLESNICKALSFQIFVSPEEVKDLYFTHDPEHPHVPAVPNGHGI